MKITLSADYRIRIPKSVVEECGLIGGTTYDLQVCEGYLKIPFIIKPNTQQITENVKEAIKELDFTSIDNNIKVVESKEIDNHLNAPTVNGIKIVSNLDEGKNFSNKYYSDCGLVIRTKRKYLTKFCESCKGYLSDQYGVDTHPCEYRMTPKEEVKVPDDIEVDTPEKQQNMISNEDTTSIATQPNKSTKKVMSIAELFGKSSTTDIKNAVMRSIKENANIIDKDLNDRITAINNIQKIERPTKPISTQNSDVEKLIDDKNTISEDGEDVDIVKKPVKSKASARQRATKSDY